MVRVVINQVNWVALLLDLVLSTWLMLKDRTTEQFIITPIIFKTMLHLAP